VDTLTSAERAIAARRLAAVRPVVPALAGIAAPEAFWELCRDELSGVDVAAGGWDVTTNVVAYAAYLDVYVPVPGRVGACPKCRRRG
jgi:hypothetical protein